MKHFFAFLMATLILMTGINLVWEIGLPVKPDPPAFDEKAGLLQALLDLNLYDTSANDLLEPIMAYKIGELSQLYDAVFEGVYHSAPGHEGDAEKIVRRFVNKLLCLQEWDAYRLALLFIGDDEDQPEIFYGMLGVGPKAGERVLSLYTAAVTDNLREDIMNILALDVNDEYSVPWRDTIIVWVYYFYFCNIGEFHDYAPSSIIDCIYWAIMSFCGRMERVFQ